MPKLSFWKVLLAVLVLALVVLFLLRENPDLDPFTYIDKASLSDPSTTPSCPDCGTGMVLRYRHKDGEPFWGCKRYPDCHGTRDWAGLTYADFKFRYEDQYHDWPEEELFNVYREMIGVQKRPGALSLDTRCPRCYSTMNLALKKDRDGDECHFLRCSRYPHCKGAIHFEDYETDWEFTR